MDAEVLTVARVFEVRTYIVAPGKLEALLQRFSTHSLPLFARHGIESVAYWVSRGDVAAGDTLVYVLAHESRETALLNWAAFQADPEWQNAKRASEVQGRLVHSIQSWFGEPAEFSPLQ